MDMKIRKAIADIKRTRELRKNIEVSDQQQTDRVLVLKKAPPPRKLGLIESGVRHIRCICCVRIKPIASAEDLGEDWICEDCVFERCGWDRHAWTKPKAPA